jgi:hypothetical protein
MKSGGTTGACNGVHQIQQAFDIVIQTVRLLHLALCQPTEVNRRWMQIQTLKNPMPHKPVNAKM